jgi:hypothetical protein
MRGTVSDRRLYLFLRDSAIVAQAAGIACLAPFIDGGRYLDRIVAFVALSMLAWWLNAVARTTGEFRHRALAKHLKNEWREELAFALFGSAFGIAAFIYLILLPTWPIFSGALLFGGCAGYVLTNS